MIHGDMNSATVRYRRRVRRRRAGDARRVTGPAPTVGAVAVVAVPSSYSWA